MMAGLFAVTMLLWGREQPIEQTQVDTRIEILRMEDFAQGLAIQQAEEESTALESNEMEMLEWGIPEGGTTATEQSTQVADFIPRVKQQEVSLDTYRDYETLVKTFYTIDSGTMAGSDQLNVDALTAFDCTIQKLDEPQILIYHTHSTEAFADSVPGDEGTGIVGVGTRLSQILMQDYGYQVMHCKNSFDDGEGVDAYANALPVISGILEENPSIQVVIDLHRDQMPEGTRQVMDVDGRETARFMFFNGISRTRKTGNIDYLKNDNLDENLSFSFQMQLKAMEYYPGLTRKIYLKSYRYNMHLKERYLLIELGAQNNTVEEAMNACYPIAHILDLVLSGQ